MASYVIESDKLFICCKDTHTLDVYEIDNLYVAPVLEKYWTYLATVHLGVGQEFDALQIGDRDIISGRDLERLMHDLFFLSMVVNREGLCFLIVQDSNVSDESQVEYYRTFDLFDWSKYYVKSRLNTSWVRNDIITGRPILEMSSGKDAELIENKRLHSGELIELKRKCSQDIEGLQQKHLEELVELKRMHSQDIEELKQKHLADLAEFERKKEKQLKAKQKEVETSKYQLIFLKRALEIHYDSNRNSNFGLFYSKLKEKLPALLTPFEN